MRQRTRPPRSDQTEPEFTDFAALFPLSAGDTDEWQFTPRTACVLQASMLALGLDALTDTTQFADQPVSDRQRWRFFDLLPATSWRQNLAWRQGMIAVLGWMTSELSSGNRPAPNCTAAALLLDRVLDHAETYQIQPQYLPSEKHPDDLQWSECRDNLVTATDHRRLYQQDVERLTPEQPEHPDRWFDVYM